MSDVNLNEIAKQITLKEGGKKIQNNGDAKEILRIIFTLFDLATICKIWFKYDRKK